MSTRCSFLRCLQIHVMARRRAAATERMQEEDYLEEEEQQEVIEQFERESARQERYLKQLLSVLGTLLAALYLIFALHQVAVPWGTRHHAAFMGVLREVAIVTGELGGCMAVLVATAAVLVYEKDQPQRLWRQLLQLSGTLATFEALFWSTAVFKVVQSDSAAALWQLLWLPLAPSVFVLLSMKAINTLAASTPELAALKASRYRYKRA